MTTVVAIQCSGDERITATHAKTFELTADHDIGPRATCVIGVGARVKGDPARLHGPVEITLDAGGHRQVVHADANPFLDPVDGLVVRKSDFRGAGTLAIGADTGAADLDRALVHAMADPAGRLDVRIRPVGPPPATVVVTDDASRGYDAPGLTVVRVHGLDGPTLPDAEEVVATSALAQMAACAALARPGEGPTLVLGPLPRGATARRAFLAAATASAPVVVWRGPAGQAEPLLALDQAVVAVDRGEAVTRIGARPDRIPADAVVTVAVAGETGEEAGLAPLLAALKAEGVSARTLRQALARLPHLADRWGYDELNRL